MVLNSFLCFNDRGLGCVEIRPHLFCNKLAGSSELHDRTYRVPSRKFDSLVAVPLTGQSECARPPSVAPLLPVNVVYVNSYHHCKSIESEYTFNCLSFPSLFVLNSFMSFSSFLHSRSASFCFSWARVAASLRSISFFCRSLMSFPIYVTFIRHTKTNDITTTYPRRIATAHLLLKQRNFVSFDVELSLCGGPS